MTDDTAPRIPSPPRRRNLFTSATQSVTFLHSPADAAFTAGLARALHAMYSPLAVHLVGTAVEFDLGTPSHEHADAADAQGRREIYVAVLPPMRCPQGR